MSQTTPGQKMTSNKISLESCYVWEYFPQLRGHFSAEFDSVGTHLPKNSTQKVEYDRGFTMPPLLNMTPPLTKSRTHMVI